MAGLLYASLHDKLMVLPDDLRVYPGHGAGSLCGRNMRAGQFTSIGQERRSNQALQARSRHEFVERVALDLPQQPANFGHIKELNKHGAPMRGGSAPRPIDPAEAVRLLDRGCVLVDIRGLMDFCRGHVLGAVNIPIAQNQFASRAGQLLAPGTPIILIHEDIPDALPDNATAVEKAARALASVGYDRVVGYVEGGLGAWQRASLPVVSIALRQAAPGYVVALLADESAGRPQLIDVREPWEWEQGHLPEAIHIPLYQLERRAREVEQCRPVIAYCRGGNRSQTAALILAQLGHRSSTTWPAESRHGGGPATRSPQTDRSRFS